MFQCFEINSCGFVLSFAYFNNLVALDGIKGRIIYIYTIFTILYTFSFTIIIFFFTEIFDINKNKITHSNSLLSLMFLPQAVIYTLCLRC